MKSLGGRPSKAVEVNGVEYPSLAQAARAMAVHPDTLRKVLVGDKVADFDPGPRPRTSGAKQMVVGGVAYPSLRALAEEFGVTPQTIRNIIKRGELPRITEILTRPRSEVSRRPITIRGVTYVSHTAAAEALGVSLGAISQAIRRGRLDLVGMGQGYRGKN